MPTTAHIYPSELDHMSACMARYPRLETGGDLFGLWTHEGAPVVMLATGPGPRARRSSTSFWQDPEFLETEHARLWQRHGLVNLGEWHSHHHIGLAEPSGGDEATVWNGLAGLGWSRFLLVIGNFPFIGERQCSFGLSVFHAEHHRLESVGARILQGTSPFRETRAQASAPSWSIRAPRLPWAARPESRALISPQLRSLGGLRAHGIQADPIADGDRLVITLTGERTGSITLAEGFPARAPVSAGWPRSQWHDGQTIADWVLTELAIEAAAAARAAARVRVPVLVALAVDNPEDEVTELMSRDCLRRILEESAARADARTATATLSEPEAAPSSETSAPPETAVRTASEPEAASSESSAPPEPAAATTSEPAAASPSEPFVAQELAAAATASELAAPGTCAPGTSEPAPTAERLGTPVPDLRTTLIRVARRFLSGRLSGTRAAWRLPRVQSLPAGPPPSGGSVVLQRLVLQYPPFQECPDVTV